MSTDEQMHGLLSELATADTPPIDPSFVEQLEVRMRVAHAERSAEPAHRRVLWIPACAVVVVLVVGLVGTIIGRRGQSDLVVMTVASDTSVYLEDGPVPGTPGLVLPNGTRIVVGQDGEAVVDGVILAPGSEAVVDNAGVTLVVTGNDQLSTNRDRATIVVPPDNDRGNVPPSPTATQQSPSPSIDGDGPDAEPTIPTSPPTTIPSDAVTDRSTPGVDSTDPGSRDTGATVSTRPASTSTTSEPPTRPSTTATTITPTTTPGDRITLTTTEVGDERLRLDWMVGRDLTPAGWRIRARLGDREATILVIRGGDNRSVTIERAVVHGRSLWVEAVDRSGRTLAASAPIPVD